MSKGTSRKTALRDCHGVLMWTGSEYVKIWHPNNSDGAVFGLTDESCADLIRALGGIPRSEVTSEDLDCITGTILAARDWATAENSTPGFKRRATQALRAAEKLHRLLTEDSSDE